jgi:hypothetical protein
VADAAADALEAELGERPDIDCGYGSVTIAEGREVDCVLTDPASGNEYDTTVTTTDVDGREWHADVRVADAVNGAGASEEPSTEAPQAPEDTQTPQDGVQIVTASATAIAAAAADALEGTYGQRPAIDCGTLEIQLYEVRMVHCDLTDPASGEVHEAAMNITGFDGDQWQFDIEVAPEPK